MVQEILGSFYLGAEYDLKAQAIGKELINYDSRDLCTHAVCVGMTGSGKTGLCIGLLEEAAMDKIPAIIIDPKGDMTNLLLQFENLAPDDFQKWTDPDEAGRKGLSPEAHAAATAKKWEEGLNNWGQGKERIAALKNAVDYTIYTPGSDSGVSINIMGSFAAPSVNFDDDAEMLNERIQGTVAALLGMIDNKEDPSRSREGILLATLFEHFWRKGEDLDLASLIRGIQKPPFSQLGVFDVDTFFPEKDRFQLAMDFNSLVASPSFRYWLQGEPLDIEKIYFTPEGKPKHSIFYIAHLSDSERMFFVTLLLNSLITWMRRQSGTSSLRSLLYFDEIFGYFPPTAEPPSKKPLLTLLKQARAFGVGAVLVTQNPVDIDYKGLSNAGTWFIGKLQTERDKMRVLDGLKGAIAEAGTEIDIDFSEVISSLNSRVFLLHNVHDSAPQVYHTRWAMSYLRGPMTRPQVKELMESRKDNSASTGGPFSVAAKAAPAVQKETAAVPPSVDPSIDQRYFAVWKSASEAASELRNNNELKIEYEPVALSIGKVRFYDAKSGLDEIESFSLLTMPPDDFGRVNFEDGLEVVDWEKSLLAQPDHPEGIGVAYESVPDAMNSKKELSNIEKEFSNWLYQSKAKTVLEHKKLKLRQEVGESIVEFQSRVQQIAREERDEELDDLQDKFQVKLDRLEDKIRKEEQDVQQATAEVQDRKTAEIVGVAETIFSVFVKRRSRSISAATSRNRMKRRAKEKLAESKEDLEELHDDYHDLENDLKEKLDEIKEKWESIEEGLSRAEVKPRRTDVKVDGVILAWHPYWVAADGSRVSARK
jgi:hypothetical protein